MFKQILVAIASLIFTANQSFGTVAETPAEEAIQPPSIEEQWHATGYGINSLFNESDFRVNQCLSSESRFAGCLMALNYAAQIVERNPQTVVASGDGVLRLTPTEPVEFESPEQYQEHQRLLRDSYVAYYNFLQQRGPTGDFDTKSDLEPINSELDAIFAQVRMTLEQDIPVLDQAFVASRIYNQFLVATYDPHSRIAIQEARFDQGESLVGIGANIMKYVNGPGELANSVVIRPFPGSPADQAGLKKGDAIIAIDGRPVADTPINELNLLGEAGTNVTLTVNSICDGENKEVVVTRGHVTFFNDILVDSEVITVDQYADPISVICAEGTKTLDNGEVITASEAVEMSQLEDSQKHSLYIPLRAFRNLRDTNLCSAFANLLYWDLQNDRSTGTILDLRGNPGGRLDQVACMIDLIDREAPGTPMIGRVPVDNGVITSSQPRISFVFGDVVAEGLPAYDKNIVVLVDNYSASASEVFSGSIQDIQRGWVVGERTFGKGSIQGGGPGHSFDVSNDPAPGTAGVTFWETIGLYTLPSGRTPQNVGVIPDFIYNKEGEKLSSEDLNPTWEASQLTTIEYPQPEWEQPRPLAVSKISECVTQREEEFYANIDRSDERYSRPFIQSDFQLTFARGVMVCDSQAVTAAE